MKSTPFIYESDSGNNTDIRVIPKAAIICTFISCGLSVFGCVGILVTYIQVSVIRNYIRKLLMFLTLTNFIHVCSKLTGTFMYVYEISPSSDKFQFTNATKLCIAQGVVSAYAPMAIFLWSTVIAVYFHTQVLQTSCREKLASVRSTIVSHCLCWITPAIVCAVGLHYHVYGVTRELYITPGCYIDTDRLSHNQQLLWMMLTKIGWECVFFLVIAEVAVYTAWKLVVLPWLHPWKSHPKCSDVFGDTQELAPDRLRPADRNFLWAWFIIYGLRVWGVILFFIRWAKPETDKHSAYVAETTLTVLQAICDPGQAFVHFLLFCVFDKDVRAHFCSRCVRQNEMNDVNELAEKRPILWN